MSNLRNMTKDECDAAVHGIATRFIERCESLRLTGVKRDNYALEYMVGATTGLRQVLGDDHQLVKQLGTICALIIAVRGYIGVAELARGVK